MLISVLGFSQNTIINKDNFNEVVFHRILLEKINEYRSVSEVGSLTNNLYLSKAAQDQSNFLIGKKVLTHSQPTPGKRTVQERVLNYVKPSNYAVGENIAQTYVLKNAYNYQRDGSTKASVASTYEQAATYMLNSWIQSNSHNENLLNQKYELSGMASHYDPTEGKLTTVHVFARLH